VTVLVLAVAKLGEEATLPGRLLVVVEPDVFEALLGRRGLALHHPAVNGGSRQPREAGRVEALAGGHVVAGDGRSRRDVLQKRSAAAYSQQPAARTKDRRYESKDSREMEKCSMSPKLLLVSDEARDDRYLRGHWPFSSVGDGCSRSALRWTDKTIY